MSGSKRTPKTYRASDVAMMILVERDRTAAFEAQRDELLAALRELLPLAECYVRDRKSHGERIDAARAAIAKATGEQS